MLLAETECDLVLKSWQMLLLACGQTLLHLIACGCELAVVCCALFLACVLVALP